jgi:hypothetical protein
LHCVHAVELRAAFAFRMGHLADPELMLPALAEKWDDDHVEAALQAQPERRR